MARCGRDARACMVRPPTVKGVGRDWVCPIVPSPVTGPGWARGARVWARRWATRPHRPRKLVHTLARVVHGLVHTALLAPVRKDSSTQSTGLPRPPLSSVPVRAPSSSLCSLPCPGQVCLGVTPVNASMMGGWLHACIRLRHGSRCSRAPMQSARGDLFTQTASQGLARAQAHATPVQPVLPSSSVHSSQPSASSPWKETGTAFISLPGSHARPAQPLGATPAFPSYTAPLASIAQALRSILFTNATTATCVPRRRATSCAQRARASSRRGAVRSAALAP